MTTMNTMMNNNSPIAADVSHCNTFTIIYEDENVVLFLNKFGAYVEHLKRSLEDILRDNPDEDTEEAIEILHRRDISVTL